MAKRAKAPRRAGELAPKPDNPRKITPAALQALGTTMRRYGDLSGIVLNRRTGHVVGGHQRLKHIPEHAKVEIVHRHRRADAQGTVAVGFLELDGQRWYYREVDVDKATEDAMNLRANNQAGDWEQEQLAALVAGLRQAGTHDVTVLGFAPGFLDRLLAQQQAGETPEPKLPKVPAKPKSRKRKVYELGRHRLLCGDARDPELVAQLFGNRTAQLVYTDPPYGVEYRGRKLYPEIVNDDKKRDELLQLLAALFRAGRKHTDPHAAWYVWHATATRQEFLHALRSVGLLEIQQITWVKNNMAGGWGHYRWATEHCFYAGDPEAPPKWYGGRDQHTAWRVTSRDAGGLVVTTLAGGVLITDGAGRTLYCTTGAPKGKKVRHMRLLEDEQALLVHPDETSTAWEVARDSDAQHPTQKPVALALRALRNSSQEGDVVYDGCAGAGATLLAAELLNRTALVAEQEPGYCDVIRQRYADLVGDKTVSPTGRLSE